MHVFFFIELLFLPFWQIGFFVTLAPIRVGSREPRGALLSRLFIDVITLPSSTMHQAINALARTLVLAVVAFAIEMATWCNCSRVFGAERRTTQCGGVADDGFVSVVSHMELASPSAPMSPAEGFGAVDFEARASFVCFAVDKVAKAVLMHIQELWEDWRNGSDMRNMGNESVARRRRGEPDDCPVVDVLVQTFHGW
jgi:hypothetical protein